MIKECGQCTYWDEDREYCSYNHRDFVHYNTSACAAGQGMEEEENEESAN